MRHRSTIVAALVVALAYACGGGGGKKPVNKPGGGGGGGKTPIEKASSEEDREKLRLAAAQKIVPEGTNCWPASIKPGDAAPRLELGTVDNAPVLCAYDTEITQLLGPIACWTLDLESGALTYRPPAPLPGRGFLVRLDGRCARGYCLPESAVLPTPPVVHLAWAHGSPNVAVAIPGNEPEIHVFDAASKAAKGVIKPKDAAHADKAMTTDLAGVMFVGDTIAAIGGAGEKGAPVWLFKADGTVVGAVDRLGGKSKGPVSVARGSVSIFGDGMLALNEDAMATLTVIEVATGKRAKLVRKPPRSSCKAKDVEALLGGASDKASDKCKADFVKSYEPLVGATVVQGKKNHLVLLRGARYGELAVVDAKTLEERRHFPAAWCDAKQDGAKPDAGKASDKSDD